jgi:hypothetical protein
MEQPVRLERRNYHETLETWLDVDAGGGWRPSPDVARVWVKSAHDYAYILQASAASAFITHLRRNGREHTAAEVHWRWTHQAPVPPLAPSTTGTIRVLPGQLGLFDAIQGET